MLIKSMAILNMLHDHTINSSKTVSWDITLLFQTLNTAILLFIFIGIPFIIYRVLKKNSVKRKEMDLLNKKMDKVIEKLDER